MYRTVHSAVHESITRNLRISIKYLDLMEAAGKRSRKCQRSEIIRNRSIERIKAHSIERQNVSKQQLWLILLYFWCFQSGNFM